MTTRDSMKVSVIIPVLNKWELTRACLESVREHTRDDLEILLVDNASTDATATEADAFGKALFGGDFIYLPQPVNRNFSASCNIGARASSGELLFFLNNDTLLTPGWLPPLMAAILSGSAAAAGPLLMYPDFAGRRDRVQHLGIVFDPQMHPKHLYEGFPARHRLCVKARDFQAITGAALLMRHDLFMDMGLFDEEFINGGEDVEFGLRLRKEGLRVLVEHSSAIYHLASQTPGIHNHVAHNAKILKQKAASVIVPDFSLFAADDGYIFRLGPSLSGFFELSESRNVFWEKERADFDESALLEMLEKEPLWHGGYGKLAALREKDGRFEEAAADMFMSLRFREDPLVAERLLELACKARHSKYAAYAGKVLSWYKEENFVHVQQAAEFMQGFCMDSGMKAVASAYADWVDKSEVFKAFYVR